MSKPLAEQVAELERERDTLVLRFEGLRASLRQSQQRVHELVEAKADSDMRLASAKVEGAREALTACAEWIGANSCGIPFSVRGGEATFPAHHVRAFRDREYPAPASGEPVTCADYGYCVAPTVCKVGSECFAKPTPPNAPEPLEFLVHYRDDVGNVNTMPTYVRITPADARRIVEMAQGGTDA